MGKEKDNIAVVDLARELLELAYRGAKGNELSRPLETLKPHLDKVIYNVFSRWDGRPPLSKDDLCQETYLKMLTKPPSRKEGANPLARIGAWTRTVAFRILVTESRRAKLRAIDYEDVLSQTANTSMSRPHDRMVEERLWFQKIVKQLELEGESMRVIGLARACYKHKTIDPCELASILNTSVDNIYQLRHRLRKLLAVYVDLEKEKKKK